MWLDTAEFLTNIPLVTALKNDNIQIVIVTLSSTSENTAPENGGHNPRRSWAHLAQVVRIDKPYGDSPPATPTEDVNYHRDLMDQGWRQGLKPLTISQPEGASFVVSPLQSSVMSSRCQ